MKTLISVLILILVAWGIYAVAKNYQTSMETGTSSATTTQNLSVEEYVKQHISTLSPASSTLGGTFYVTSIETHGGAGTVHYEDGHNAYIGDFTYDISASGTPSVKTFVIR